MSFINNSKDIYFINNIIKLLNENITQSIKLVDDLYIARNRRSQIILVQIEHLNGNANEEWDLSLIGTKVVAKFYDSAYYTPSPSEWVGSTESYMEYLAENEATAYE